MDVSVVVVNFNTKDKLSACLESIQKNSGGLSVEVIAVDNASSDGSAQMVRERFPNVKLIQNSENRYFTGANNQGMAAATGRNILILNSDTLVLENSLSAMSSYLDSNPGAGAVTCRMYFPDGSFYKNAAKDFTFGLALLNCTFLGAIFKSAKRRMNEDFGYAGYDWAQNHDVEMIGDCNMMLPRKVYEKIGPYDENMKLYYTENDLCLRIRKLGMKIVYVAAGRVEHHLRGTVSQSGLKKISKIYEQDTLVYFKRYHGFASAAILKILITMTNILLSVVHAKQENIFSRFLTNKKSA